MKKVANFIGPSLRESTSFEPFCVKICCLQGGAGEVRKSQTAIGMRCRRYRSACDEKFASAVAEWVGVCDWACCACMNAAECRTNIESRV